MELSTLHAHWSVESIAAYRSSDSNLEEMIFRVNRTLGRGLLIDIHVFLSVPSIIS